MSWYYSKGGEQIGPVSQEKIDALASQGEIGEKTLVWKEGMSEWKAYGDLKEGSMPQPESQSIEKAAETAPQPKEEKRYPLHFEGKGSEYFGIWIVNLLLSIVTLGLYIPWARVRTRRYFYQNTKLDGYSFEYLADPKKLLIGYVIVFVGLIIYSSSQFLNPIISLLVLLVYMVVFPFLMYKSMRFFSANSAYRNISFKFRGTLGEAYRCFLGMPLLAMFTLGLIMPLVIKMQKEYFFDNMAYGQKRSHFHGSAGFFFKVFYAAFGIFIGLTIASGVLMGVAYASSGFAGDGGEDVVTQLAEILGFIFMIAFYIFIFVIFIGADVFIKNYCWNETVLGTDDGEGQQFRFENKIKLWPYVGIFISNLILTILTLGLFAPWAKVRLYRYRVQCMSVSGMESLENVVAQAADHDGAVGDSAHELLDFEFGL
ncbi:MAG: DUF898 family protein [Verrucomicrobiota bacterium]